MYCLYVDFYVWEICKRIWGKVKFGICICKDFKDFDKENVIVYILKCLFVKDFKDF